MNDFQKENNNDDWKDALRSALIAGITGGPSEAERVYSQIGYYYLCSAPAFLYNITVILY